MRSRCATRVLLSFSLFLVSACWRTPLEEGDRELLLTVGALRSHGLELPQGFEAHETFTRETWFDGAVTLNYEFSAPEELGLPYLWSMSEIHRSKRDACFSRSAIDFGTKLGGVEVSERNDLFSYGDESRFALLVDDDGPYGNCFSMCSGRAGFAATLAGFYFDDGQSWSDVVRPALDALRASAGR